jgi:hypothetical protein
VPLALLYDQVRVVVALGWLAREARRTGFLPWEKLSLAATYPLALLTWPIGTGWHVPLGPVVSGLLLVACLRRVGHVG